MRMMHAFKIDQGDVAVVGACGSEIDPGDHAVVAACGPEHTGSQKIYREIDNLANGDSAAEAGALFRKEINPLRTCHHAPFLPTNVAMSPLMRQLSSGQ